MIKVEFEGTDGAGKTTGLKYFIERAQQRGLTVVETREVGNPNVPSCVRLREFVLDPANKLTGEAMEFIFAAMRMENDKWFRELNKSVDSPNMVVSDRGWLSHLAYTDHNVSFEFTDLFYRNVVEQITSLPDVVVYFTVNTDTALKRRVKRGGTMDVIEMKGIEYQEKVRGSFELYIERLYDNGVAFFEIDANQDLENVKKQLDIVLDEISEFYFE